MGWEWIGGRENGDDGDGGRKRSEKGIESKRGQDRQESESETETDVSRAGRESERNKVRAKPPLARKMPPKMPRTAQKPKTWNDF